jgi:hypothetical protein
MHLSAIAVAEPPYAPGRYILIRMDLVANDRWFWCGRSLGWLPANVTTSLYHRLYRTVTEAEQAMLRYHTWPLQ